MLSRSLRRNCSSTSTIFSCSRAFSMATAARLASAERIFHVLVGIMDTAPPCTRSARRWPRRPHSHRHGQQRDQPLLARHFGVPILVVLLHIVDAERLAAADDEADQAIVHRQRRLLEVLGPRAVAGTKFQEVTRRIEQHERADLRVHQAARIAGDVLEDLLQVQRGDDRLGDGEK